MSDFRRVMSYFYGQPWALERGLADKVATLEQVLQKAAGRGKAPVAVEEPPVAAVESGERMAAVARLRAL